MRKKINIQFNELHPMNTWSYSLVDQSFKEFLNNFVALIIKENPEYDIVLDSHMQNSDNIANVILTNAFKKYKISGSQIFYSSSLSDSDLVLAVGNFTQNIENELSSVRNLIYFQTKTDEVIPSNAFIIKDDMAHSFSEIRQQIKQRI